MSDNENITKKPIRCDVTIIGTGMAGMAASLFAVNRGLSVVQVGFTGEIIFASGYLDGNWGLYGTAQVLPYILLLVLLLFKPHGLFGTHEIERV